MMSHNWKRYWMGWWSRSLSRRFAEANISVRMRATLAHPHYA